MVLITILTILTFFLCLTLKWTLPLSGRVPNYYFIPIVLGTFLLRIPFLTDLEIDVDASTWIASAISIDYYPDKLWKFLTFTDSRPLTVLPVYLLLYAGVPINYITTEVLALVIWILIIGVNFLTLRYLIPEKAAFILSSCCALFIGSCNASDFTAYNSEYISILMLSVATLVAVKVYVGQYSLIEILLSGLTLGAVIYAKFQNAPMGLVIAGFTGLLLLNRKKFKILVWFIVMGIVPTLLILLAFTWKGASDQFWINYLFNYLEYSFTTQFQPLYMTERFNPLRAMRFILHYYQSRLFFGTLLSGLAVGLYFLLRTNQIRSALQSPIVIFSLLLLISSLYAVLQSGNSFGHYLLYLIIPLVFLLAVIGRSVKPTQFSTLCLLLISGTAFQMIMNWVYNHHRIPPETFRNDKAIVKVITDHSADTDNIVIWGWVDRLHHLSARACGYSMAHTHHLFLHKSSLLPYRIQSFLNDLKTNNPALFIEDIDGKYSPLPGIFRSLDEYPEIRQYISQHYSFLTMIDGIKIYKRKIQEP